MTMLTKPAWLMGTGSYLPLAALEIHRLQLSREGHCHACDHHELIPRSMEMVGTFTTPYPIPPRENPQGATGWSQQAAVANQQSFRLAQTSFQLADSTT